MLHSCVCRWAGNFRIIPYWTDELGIDWVEIGYKEALYEDEESEDIPILMMSGAFEIAHWGL
jgi:hypothetical protein